MLTIGGSHSASLRASSRLRSERQAAENQLEDVQQGWTSPNLSGPDEN